MGVIVDRLTEVRVATENALKESGKGGLIPRLTVAEHDDVHIILNALLNERVAASEALGETTSKYALSGTEEDREAALEAAKRYARTITLYRLACDLHAEQMVSMVSEAFGGLADWEQELLNAHNEDARRFSEETPGYEGPITRG